MPKNKYTLLTLLLLVLLSSCYHPRRQARRIMPAVAGDTLVFANKHHYGHNFNFVVHDDSLPLIRQLPEEQINDLTIDTFMVYKNDRLVVADIRILPNDTVDSVWVQLARDQSSIGWTHEMQLLPAVDPDDPISQFITFFSDAHLLWFLIILSVVVTTYCLRMMIRRDAYIVHLRDISSFYPTMLAVTVALAATLYSTIQLFTPDAWRHFYFHPTLNPFAQPPLLMLFLISVWSMLIIAIAAVDDTFRSLPLVDALLYLLGLGGVCAINYIIFSLSTLYHIGYLLLPVYAFWALRHYFRHHRSRYICGNCGRQLARKGICPYCKAVNVAEKKSRMARLKSNTLSSLRKFRRSRQQETDPGFR